MERYDVVVVGVGGMGSAALYHLARRGKRVLGLERFDLLHERGSSHGLTRIIRLAYFEHPDYVPLAAPCLRALARARDRRGRAAPAYHRDRRGRRPEILEGVLRSCAEHDIEHEVLTGAEVAARFPAYRPAGRHGGRVPAGRRLRRPRAVHRRARRGRARARCRRCARASACSSGPRRENGVRVRTDRGDGRGRAARAHRGRMVAGRRAPARRAPCAAVRQVARVVPAHATGALRRPSGCRSSTSSSTVSTSTGFPRTGSRESSSAATSASGRERRSRRHLTRADGRRTRRASASSRAATSLRARGRRSRSRPASSSSPPTSTSSSTATRSRDAVVVGAGFSGHGYKFCSVDRRDPRRPRDRRLDAPRHRALPARPFRHPLANARRLGTPLALWAGSPLHANELVHACNRRLAVDSNLLRAGARAVDAGEFAGVPEDAEDVFGTVRKCVPRGAADV